MSLFAKKSSDAPRRRLVNQVEPYGSVRQDAFKRNRTLTGATSNISGLAGKNDPDSTRKRVHHLTNHRRKVISVLALVLLIALTLWTFIANLTAGVDVTISGLAIVQPVDKSIYQKTIQDYLDSHPLSRLQFVLDENDLSIYVAGRMPEVVSVSQRGMKSLGQTKFNLVVRTPVAGWRINDKQYYVDSKGISFDRNYFAEPDVQIIDENSKSLPTGIAIASNRFLGFVGRVVSIARSSGYIVTQAIIPVDTTRELKINLKDNATAVKLSIDRPVGEQIEDMSKAMGYFSSHGISPAYVDMRVSGKAFYK